MDNDSYLQIFEKSLSLYTGDDPLDLWDKFVAYLEPRLPADGGSEMPQALDHLVQRFVNVDQYANDIRYVKYCIKYASYYPDPIALYSHLFSRGIGTKTAAFYVSWAKQFEQGGSVNQADAVFQKALENQAQPTDIMLNEHRQFQTRNRIQAPSPAGIRAPLQNSHVINQMSSQREPAAQPKAWMEGPAALITVSRSENLGVLPSSQGPGVRTVSEYMTEELLCEGSELCFEEVRARKYFEKLRAKQAQEEREREEKLRKEEDSNLKMKYRLEEVNQEQEWIKTLVRSLILPSSLQCAHPPRLSRRSLSLRLHTEPTFFQEASSSSSSLPELPAHLQRGLSAEASQHAPVLADRSVQLPQFAPTTESTDSEQMNVSLHRPACTSADFSMQEDPESRLESQQEAAHPPEFEERLNMSQGGTANLSHITPNTSLGFVQATPSRVLPSPTVNTREALGVIMDMFQAPTLLKDPFDNTSVLLAGEQTLDPGHQRNGVSSFCAPPTAAPFTVFQDDIDKENGSTAAPFVVEKSKPMRALAEIPVSNKPNETPPDLMSDESTMWGAHFNSLHSLAACPNSTSDFAMLAQFVSTPFTNKSVFNFCEDKVNKSDGGDTEDDAFTRRQPKKLSPIMEQSPSTDTAYSELAPSEGGHGTIVGEGLAPAPPCLSSSSSCTTIVQPPPPAMLSFREQTLCSSEASRTMPAAAVGPDWDVYTKAEPFTIMEDSQKPPSPERVQQRVQDIPMSPDYPPKPDWLAFSSPDYQQKPLRSPEPRGEFDLDAFVSPRLQRNTDVPMSPEAAALQDEPMMSPDRKQGNLVSDPWDDDLIARLLASLSPPLTTHPRCITWQCNVPNIAPKTTISMGKASLRVDCVLGQGAFATVYQGTDPMTSEKMVLKVQKQKPGNPWEYYINTQLDARLQPGLRQLFSRLHSAHLFHNGCVMLGELYNYGTLLNAVNIFKTQSDKVMPQPLVMYFSVCILQMVETLHSIRVIHADIKPDNFLLGERFLENRCFQPENLDHGLVLIDFGQSIDLDLFPEGTAFTGKCLTSGFQCTEMISGKPWSFQTDYFGIAGTVYCMLFGTYMQVTSEGGAWKTNGVFRRNPHSDLWVDFFHTLLNSPPHGALQSLRLRLTSVLQQNYSSKLPTLKSRLTVLLLEARKAARR
ncbi:hypothetical protein PBY51_006399 [Eleginops maclovinus]|uniref:Mitotic checkpoint serine/threonine-protein kinase BUB1 n=1 Tax=Eleginops maclovinus TaxID=56733 RepID=A0AAN7X127_ELEMC|nr:hypothetical protein PBY51_006399 [Eleginops maclovinus]